MLELPSPAIYSYSNQYPTPTTPLHFLLYVVFDRIYLAIYAGSCLLPFMSNKFKKGLKPNSNKRVKCKMVAVDPFFIFFFPTIGCNK